MQAQKMLGTTYYRFDPKDKNYYQTMSIGWNMLNNRYVERWTNYVYGTPQEHWQEYDPRIGSALRNLHVGQQPYEDVYMGSAQTKR